jgi:hypothetical protein
MREEYFPATQEEHRRNPVPDAYAPAGQFKQVSTISDENVAVHPVYEPQFG